MNRKLLCRYIAIVIILCYILINKFTIAKGGSLLNFNSKVSTKSSPSSYTLKSLSTYDTDFYNPNKFSILFIKSGSGTGIIDHSSFHFFGSTIICLNENERLTLTKSLNVEGKILTFEPSAIRDYFTFDNISTFEHYFTPSDINMAINLSVFYQRDKDYFGYIQTPEITMKQLNKLVEQLSMCTSSVSVSTILNDIMAVIKRLVQHSLSVSKLIITETNFEVKDVLLYLHNNCSQKITIPKLSKHFHVNRTTLSDRFFEATGETIITYLNKYRINLAAIMLRESNQSISSIAEEVGFNDTAYFAKLFKKYMFHTPSEYRQRYVSLCSIEKIKIQDKKGH